LDWDSRLSNLPFLQKILFSKKIIVLRNGIFLDRLPESARDSVSNLNQIYPNRVVYLGRVTSWKGLSKFYSCVSLPELSKSKILMMIPSINSGNIEELMEPTAFARTTIVSGKTILGYSPSRLDIHFYPVEYPRNAKYIESISLNCLEMACLGVRSFVSVGGLSTWPDLADSGIFVEIDWNQLDDQLGPKLNSSKEPVGDDEINVIRGKIDIQNQIDSYLKFFEP
jgi:hypothetical protein